MGSQARQGLEAVLWDMDGTLVDTEPLWMAAQRELARAYGAEWTSGDAHATVGQAMSVSAGMLQRQGVDLPVGAIINELVKRVVALIDNGVPWLPGAERILSDLGADSIPCGLVTMAFSPVAARVAAAAPVGVFHAIVAGDDVEHGKPHPAPYLTAAELLGVSAERCVAIEDSLSGTTSAQAAGMQVVVVPGIVQVPPAPGRHFVESLEAVSVQYLRDVLKGART